MPKSTTFTSIASIPHHVSRESVIAFLHDHKSMIELNPLVTEYHAIAPPVPPKSTSQESVPSQSQMQTQQPHDRSLETWYSITDTLMPHFLPHKVSYKSSFHLFDDGMGTTSLAPLGLTVQARWSVSLDFAGEKYLREDVELTCPSVMIGFVKRTVKKAHGEMVQKIIHKAAESQQQQQPSPQTQQPQSQSQQSQLRPVQV